MIPVMFQPVPLTSSNFALQFDVSWQQFSFVTWFNYANLAVEVLSVVRAKHFILLAHLNHVRLWVYEEKCAVQLRFPRSLHSQGALWRKRERKSARHKTISNLTVVVGSQNWSWEVFPVDEWITNCKVASCKLFCLNANNARKLSTQSEIKWGLVFCTPQNWEPCVVFMHEVSLRSWTSLFSWGHLFAIFVACGKFCKSVKFGF